MSTLKDFDNETLIEYCNILKEELEIAKTSLRDKFAMSVLPAVFKNWTEDESFNLETDVDLICKDCYDIADSMIKARE
jgi:hypothetical protein